MKFQPINPRTTRIIDVVFIIIITYVNIISVSHFIVWKRMSKFTSPFFKTGTTDEGNAMETIRNLANQTGYILLILLLASVMLTILNRRYFWFIIITLVTTIVGMYLGTQVTHLPN